jgi:hypothetical protein
LRASATIDDRRDRSAAMTIESMRPPTPGKPRIRCPDV